MNIVVEKQPKCVAILRVEIPSEKVTVERDRVVKSFVTKAGVPGYRRGKAPRAVVEKRFKKEIFEELSNQLVNEAYDAAIAQESLDVLDCGIPEDLTIAPGGSLTFVAKITLAPVVALPEYKGLPVNVPSSVVSDEQITDQLAQLQERFADYEAVTDRAAAMGDLATIDFTSTVDGKPTEEFLSRPEDFLKGQENFRVRIDEKAFLPGFAAQLVGMNPGDSRAITITLPSDFMLTELADKEITFQTLLKELKATILPVLDDALAARLIPGETMESIKEIIRKNMTEQLDRKIREMSLNQIITQLIDKTDFELPDHLVAAETQVQADKIVKQYVQSGMPEGEIESRQHEIFEKAGQDAESSIRVNFIVQEIAKIEEMTVADNEMVQYLSEMANQRQVPVQKLIKSMRNTDSISNLRRSMLIGKTVDFLVDHANVVETVETTIDD
jgi:trigger factor